MKNSNAIMIKKLAKIILRIVRIATETLLHTASKSYLELHSVRDANIYNKLIDYLTSLQFNNYIIVC